MNSPGYRFGELFQLLEGRGNYASGEVARVSGVKFVWLCTIGQGRDVRR